MKVSKIEKGFKDIKSNDDIKAKPMPNSKEKPCIDHNTEKHLYDSLMRKKQLFRLLEKEGLFPKKEQAEIDHEIESALNDLEKIIMGKRVV